MPPILPRPLVVVWRVTEACDLGCWYCEYNRHLRRPRHSLPAAPVLAFGGLLGRYAAETGRPVLLSWLGGEPLVWPALVTVGQALRQLPGLRLGLTTNGARLTDRHLLQHLAESYAEITFSLDGLAVFHDASRAAPGLFARLRRAVADLHEAAARAGRDPLLRANVIIMRSNLHAFGALCEDLAGWGIQEVTFNALGGQPPGPHYLRERLGTADVDWLAAALPALRQRLSPLGLVIRGDAAYLHRLSAGARGQLSPVTDCHPGAEFLFVDEHARVSPCSFTGAGYGMPVAELCSPADLARLPNILAERRRAAWQPACYDCPSTQVFGKFAFETP